MLTNQTNDVTKDKWRNFYGNRSASAGRYPTEWVVRTLAGGRYPKLSLDKSRYLGSRILDMGCGDGRNLPLLQDLGFDVHACEISSDIVTELEAVAKTSNWGVQFSVGRNLEISYADSFFDYMLCCSSCYYMETGATWGSILNELSRVLKVGGILVANFPDLTNFIFKNSMRNKDGSYLITSDPYGLRNGMRLMAVANEGELASVLGSGFRILGIGHQDDDFYGSRVSGYFLVAEKIEK
jgi:SAM-dependent methyltransferase